METTELIAMIREGVRGCDPGDTMMFPETGKIICVAELLEVADRLEKLAKHIRIARAQRNHAWDMESRARGNDCGAFQVNGFAPGDQDEVLWVCCVGGPPVGIVKHYDDHEKRWKFYIGSGKGEDLDEDMEMILARGQKFYSLDFIQRFAEVSE